MIQFVCEDGWRYGQGCSTLWDSNQCEEVFESGESCAVAVLAEGAGAGFAVHQDVEGEAAQSGDDARVGSDSGSILGEGSCPAATSTTTRRGFS